MDKKRIIQVLLWSFAALAVAFPLWFRIQHVSFVRGEPLLTLFPFFGLIAFTLLWLHIMSGVFEAVLRNYIPFDVWVHYSSLVIFFCVILHPLLLLLSIDFDTQVLFTFGEPYFIYLGILGFSLLLTYDIGKFFRKRNFFVVHWDAVLAVSTVGILLIFVHSFGLGGDVQREPLKSIWIFYGATSLLGTFYTFVFAPKRAKK